MPSLPVHEWSLLEAARRVRDGEVSSRELTGALLDRIAELDPKINAYITVLPEAREGPGGGVRRGAGAGAPARSAARRPRGAQGHLLHPRRAHHLRQPDPRPISTPRTTRW